MNWQKGSRKKHWSHNVPYTQRFLAQSEAHPLLQLAASWCAVWNYTHTVCADGGSVLKMPKCEATVSYDRQRWQIRLFEILPGWFEGEKGHKTPDKAQSSAQPLPSQVPDSEQSLKIKADSVDVDVNFTYFFLFIYSFIKAFGTYSCNRLMPNPLLFGKHVIKQLIPLSIAHWLRARMIKLI